MMILSRMTATLSLASLLAGLGPSGLAQAQAANTTLAPALPSTTLPAPLAAALQNSGVPREAVSMLVMPVDGGPARLNHEAQTQRHAASVMKLFTTGVALQSLGPSYAWHTDAGLGGPLRSNGVLEGPLYVRGGGDPSLVLEKAWLMLTRWRAAGLKDIQGDIIIDRRAFNVPAHDPAAFDGRTLKPYNAGPDALLLNLQAITLRLRPDPTKPGWAHASMEPALEGVTLDAQVRLSQGGCGEWREALDLKMRPQAEASAHASTDASLPPWVVTLRGPYPQSCGERDWPVLWQGSGPGDLATRVLTTLWHEVGGKLNGRVRVGDWPADTPVWTSWESAPLGLVVRDINKFSNNVMARQLFLTLGTNPNGVSTLDQARAVVTQSVLAATRDANGTTPCANSALVMDNGSGLSRTERTSAACLSRWLQALWASPVMPELLASLPITGIDGTTKRWHSLSGKAHIKTGSLDGVVALAGVVEGASGHRYVVVGLVNHPQADAARPVMEALVSWAQRDQ